MCLDVIITHAILLVIALGFGLIVLDLAFLETHTRETRANHVQSASHSRTSSLFTMTATFLDHVLCIIPLLKIYFFSSLLSAFCCFFVITLGRHH
jgi:hypothetical protein